MRIIQICFSALIWVFVTGLFLTASGASAPPPKQGTWTSATSASSTSQIPQYILDKIARTKASQAAQPSVQQTQQDPQPATQQPNGGTRPATSVAPPYISSSYGVYRGGTGAVQSSTSAKISGTPTVSSSVTFSGRASPSTPIVQQLSVSGTAISAPEYQWKVSTPFEVSFVDGFMGVYQAGEPIVFHVEGRSPVQIEALPENGFSLAAAIYDVPRSRTIQSVAGNFDETRRAWQVTFTAPGDNAISYEVEIHLYCGRDESQCAEIYGRAAQTTKLLSLNVN